MAMSEQILMLISSWGRLPVLRCCRVVTILLLLHLVEGFGAGPGCLEAAAVINLPTAWARRTLDACGSHTASVHAPAAVLLLVLISACKSWAGCAVFWFCICNRLLWTVWPKTQA
jgi:hypothetical protein